MRFCNYNDFSDQYLRYYREKPSLPSLLEDATLGVMEITQDNRTYYIRHPHQEVFIDRSGHTRGISDQIAMLVNENLQRHIDDLMNCTDFSQIIEIVERCRKRGFGELAIYDTAVRIGAFLGIAPDKLYLHAGTREGVKALEEKGYLKEGSSKRKTLEIDEMPMEFRKLRPDEIQTFCCRKKDDMKTQLDANMLDKNV